MRKSNSLLSQRSVCLRIADRAENRRKRGKGQGSRECPSGLGPAGPHVGRPPTLHKAGCVVAWAACLPCEVLLHWGSSATLRVAHDTNSQAQCCIQDATLQKSFPQQLRKRKRGSSLFHVGNERIQSWLTERFLSLAGHCSLS